MKTDKINGIVYIRSGRLEIDSMVNTGNDVTDRVQQLLALRDCIQNNLLEHEREVQAGFRNLAKIPNQYDLESMISEIEASKTIKDVD